jgi:tRNA pseudouridine38-40 synthase
MVRNIVGALLDIGISKNSPESIKSLINSCDRKKCGKMAPASGLYLTSITYPRRYNISKNKIFHLP